MDLVVNVGSSSVKFTGFETSGVRRFEGEAALHGEALQLQVTDAEGGMLADAVLPVAADPGQGVATLVEAVADWLTTQAFSPRSVLHRVVHGGSQFVAPVLIDAEVCEALEALTVLAPLHQPLNLAGITLMGRQYPGIPQIACFDTAFHAQQSPFEQHFALPETLFTEGIRRYGFHGLSYAYLTRQLPRMGMQADARVVLCHLGSGASLCAVRGGVSIASTMGLTALDGLPMGTRTGRLDAGVVLHLLAAGWETEAITHLLYRESGLLGLSGLSADVRTLEASPDPKAQFALHYFAYRINAEIGSLVAILGGLDGLVFSGGIGTHSASVRARVLHRLASWLPLSWSEQANASQADWLSTPDSPVTVLRMATDEAAEIWRTGIGCLDGMR